MANMVASEQRAGCWWFLKAEIKFVDAVATETKSEDSGITRI